MSGLQAGDVVIINGDGAGSRGPVMNKIVKIFYEVRRGETEMSVLLDALSEIIGETPEIPQEWIYETVHAGVFRKLVANRYKTFADKASEETMSVLDATLKPLSELAKQKGIKLYYLPGNGEIVTEDFDVSDITTEKTVAPNQRFYQRIARDGYFAKLGVEYVPYAKLLPDGTLLLSTHLLDLTFKQFLEMLPKLHIDGTKVKRVVVHYPPAVAPIGGAFDFWTPNKSDLTRIGALSVILLDLDEDIDIYFGHIHLGAYDERMNRYPTIMTFQTAEHKKCHWVKPGNIIKI
jgi:hypothetical protein